MINQSTLKNTINVFAYYKSLGEKAIAQIQDEALFYTPDAKSNSISVIIKHLHGNMLSRWTDFLTSDGEKEWRQRDAEFEESTGTREELMKMWEKGWACLFNALEALEEEDFSKTVYIRNMGQTVPDAIMRQLAHYAYHVGQIVYLAKMLHEGNWASLSIPRGGSSLYNEDKISRGKRIQHFTEEDVDKGETK